MRRILIAAAVLTAIVSCAPKTRTVELFNGTDLTGWEFVVDSDTVDVADVFKVEDGIISISGQPFGYMYTTESYSSFDLDVEWAWPGEPANSGIFLLIEDTTCPFPNGIECQLHAGDAGDFIALGGSRLKEYVLPEGEEMPKFPKILKKEPSSEKPAGEWNHAHIEVRDGAITVWVNDILQNSATDLNATGRIGLQSEGGPVLFRKVSMTL